jgi:ABC-type lipoprotein export system ATPase subunit
VQVTHSEENARYGKRIVELRDGWLTRDEPLPAKPTPEKTTPEKTTEVGSK